jgi:aspartate 4-decarboxylase
MQPLPPYPEKRPGPSKAERKRLRQLSPFELKDNLIALAKDSTPGKALTRNMLNAGRGNPNWIATAPREALLLLGQFALTECRRTWSEPDLAGMPAPGGVAARLSAFLDAQSPGEGAGFLSEAVGYAIETLQLEPDAFVHELVDAQIGDNYPVPDRILPHAEKVIRRYLEQELFDGRPPEGRFDYFATEGGTAAMCYVFNSLKANRVLIRGDTVALGTPIFTPYLEIPRLEDLAFKVVSVEASTTQNGVHTWQYPDEELQKLEDPKVKAFFIVNPSNPPSMAMDERTHERLVTLVRTKRPDLLLLTDDVYATFVPGFRSIAADLPHNTLVVYSFSKHFGCTGWRLGVVGIHEQSVIDDAIARLPKSQLAALRKRYAPLTPEPRKLRFIDRMVADSRLVALNHTAGLSLPQQAQMSLFALFGLLPRGLDYKRRCRSIVTQRLYTLAKGLDVDVPELPLRANYYVELDLQAWGERNFGPSFQEYVQAHNEPIDIVLALAQYYGIVLLNGSGFDGPPWSVRVSLANLPTDSYEQIGEALRDIMHRVVERWQADTATRH